MFTMLCRLYTPALLNGMLPTGWFGWNFQNISCEIEALWLVSGLRKYSLFAGVICVVVVTEAGLETLAGGPSSSVSSGWERSRGSTEWGVISDSEDASATVDALSCKPVSCVFDLLRECSFLSKKCINFMCCLPYLGNCFLFSFEHHFYACSQTSLNKI